MAESDTSNKNVPIKLPVIISAAIAALSGFANGISLYPLVLHSYHNQSILLKEDEYKNLEYVNLFGAIVGTLVSGFACDSFGPKRVIQISAFPLFMSRLITAYCRTIYGFYAAILLHGCAIGVSHFSAIHYSTDIAEKRQITNVSLMYYLEYFFGVMCGYFIEIHVEDFILLALIPSVLPVIYLIALSFVPESPVHMCKKKDLPQARSSLQWLRGTHYDIEDEVASLQKYTKTKSNSSVEDMETTQKLISRKTLLLICSIDLVFAVLYILYFRSHNQLTNVNVMTEDLNWISMTGEFKVLMSILLMTLVKYVKIIKMIPIVFVISSIGTIAAEIIIIYFGDISWIWVPCLLTVIISHGNVLLTTLLLWQVFDYVELKTRAIPVCLTMQLFWISTCGTMPAYDIPSIYLTIVNVFVGSVVIKYFFANAMRERMSPIKTITLNNLS